MVANKFAKAIEQAAEHNDYNEAAAGFEFTPLPEGPCRLRFVQYIELGEHEKTYAGKTKVVEKARFTFEVTGPKIEPREDGNPHLIGFDLPISLSEKSGFYKLFRKMNHEQKFKVFAEMLGEAFRATIRHDDNGKEGADKRTYVTLRDQDGGFTISPPFFDDPESGERRLLKIAEPVTELGCFLWNYPDKEQWESIFIDGEYEARDDKPAKSKNKWQELIKTALNWVGSPMQELLFGDLDLGEVEAPERDDKAVEASKDKKAGAAPEADGDPLEDIEY